MKKILYYSVLLLLSSCQFTNQKFSNFSIPVGLNDAIIVPIDSSFVKKIIVPSPENSISSSEVITDVKYIPLETTPEALIGYYNKILVYKNLIYIMDYLSAEAVFIYTMEGKFIKKIGNKGGGPEEFYLLYGMSIDRNKDNLVIYDNRKRKMMYYTLTGYFIKSIDVPYRFSGQYEILPSGRMLSITSKSDGNFHLDNYDDYRLIYTDSLGSIQKFGFKYNDNIDLSVAWSKLFYCDNELLCYPQFQNSIYSVSDTLIREKYRIDCGNFTTFDFKRLSQYTNLDDFDKDWDATTNLSPYISENRTHLYFSITNERKEYYYFYNKETGNLRGTKKVIFDSDFVVEFPKLFNYEDYFIGPVSIEKLYALREYKRVKGELISRPLGNMIDSLKEEDNPPLVLFKIKNI